MKKRGLLAPGGMVIYEHPNYLADGWRFLDAAYSGLATTISSNLDYGGKSDWFLTPTNELLQIYLNLHIEGLGNFLRAKVATCPVRSALLVFQ